MPKHPRFLYFIIAIFVVILGVLSRKIHGIPLFIGDILYAVMIYFGCRMLFLKISNPKKIISPLLLCYIIELQQLCHAEWLVTIRNTTFGHYVLGQGFLWSDMVCYTVGVAVAYFVESSFLKDSNLKSNA
jgi:hypothetical protein